MDKRNENNKEKVELLRDIERYFECQLTEEEEKNLRCRLITTTLDFPELEESKAVMGFQTIKHSGPANKSIVRKINNIRIIRLAEEIAAILIVAIGVGMGIMFKNSPDRASECVAYVNGQCVTDEAKVMQILEQNIAELETGAAEARNDVVAEMADLLENINDLQPENKDE